MNSASAAAIRYTVPHAICSASKAACIALTRDSAFELARQGVGVNCVAPWLGVVPPSATTTQAAGRDIEAPATTRPRLRGAQRDRKRRWVPRVRIGPLHRGPDNRCCATTATCLLAVTDVVTHPAEPRMRFVGRGHYRDEHRFDDGVWPLATATLTRQRLDPLQLFDALAVVGQPAAPSVRP